jgi:hypothetical protein
MDVAFFRTGARASLAADTIFTIRNGHNFVAHVITEFILTLEGFLYKLQHVPAAYLVTTPAADALLNID